MALDVEIKKKLEHLRLDVAFSCGKGRILSIIGPSGSGKTTILRIIAGLAEADEGVIRCGDKTWTDTRAGICLPVQKRRVSMVFQDFTLFPHLSVYRNVCFAARDKHLPIELMKSFGIWHLRDSLPRCISGGDRRRPAGGRPRARRQCVAGMDPATTEHLAALYGLVTNVYVARDIRTAEAAKVIENVQRDLNIALMNELSIIFRKMGLETKAVLEAAGTKWNFHNYRPGLVGGHCIPVDPYYLVYKAEELGYHPQVILAGRAINDAMPKQVAEIAIKELNRAGKVIRDSKVLIMGLTYKENVPDTRESPAGEMVHELKEFDIDVYGYDPLLGPAEIERFGAKPVASLQELEGPVDCIIVNSPHGVFAALTLDAVLAICNGKPIIVDVTGMLRRNDGMREGCVYRTL